MAVIGAVTVRVVPSYSGLSKSVAQNFTAAGVMGGRAMAKPIQTSLREAVRTSITASSTKALEQVETATGAVAKAEEGLTRNRISRQSVDARVLKAEEDLSKAREDSRSTAGDIAGAEAVLEKARLDQRTANVSVVESERTLTEAKSNATKASEAHEQALSSESTMLGKISSAMPAISEHLKGMGAQWQSVGESVSGVGTSLTKSITLPIAGATTAAAGLVGALGFRRLTSIDTAQAQLLGLGYEAEDVERITDQLVDALEGGMMTMGEATSVAAGALAAGVDEGEELERYIKLVDAAAVGMGRSVDETAMIFGRVQGSGKLMTQELNMIEQFMPGFAAAMSDSLGVSQGKFREMVTEGKISSEEFMDVMEDFAGGMATSYADSFEGMVQNTLAYIGILGQNLLSGAFPQMKDALEEFVGFLASDDVAAWAQGIGESIGSAFSTAVQWVRDAITWWTELDGSTQRLILGAIGFAAALGPVLLVVGKIITVVGGIISAIGTMIPIIRGAAVAFKVLGLAMFANPIGLIITGVAALTAGLVWLFTQTEWGQQVWGTVWGAIKDATSATVSWITDSAVPWLVGAWDTISSGAQGLWDFMVTVWNGIGDAIGSTVDWIMTNVVGNIQEVYSMLFKGDFTGSGSMAEDSPVVGFFLTLRDVAMSVFGWFRDTAFPMMKSFWGGLVDGFNAVVEGIAWAWESILKPAIDAVGASFTWLWETIIQPVFGLIADHFQRVVSIIAWVWEGVLQPTITLIGDIFVWLWTDMVKPYLERMQEGWQKVADFLVAAWTDHILPMIEAFGDFVVGLYSDYVKPALDWIGEAWNWVKDTIVSLWEDYIKPAYIAQGEFALALYSDYIKPAIDWIAEAWNWVKDTIVGLWENHIKPAYIAQGEFVVGLYENYVKPALNWISDSWDWLTGKISGFWTDGIKPVLSAFGTFIKEDVPDMVRSGVEMIRDAWYSVANFFRTPINWVINTVWNNGIKKAFDNVADAVGSSAELAAVPEIGRFGGGASGSRGNIAGYAKGGIMGSGLKLVGEEGPELIATGPGWVATAAESKRLLATSDPALTPEETAALSGSRDTGPYGIGGNWLSRTASSAWNWTVDRVQDTISWVRGGLAKAAETLLKPILSGVSGFTSQFGGMGQLGSGLIDHGVDSVMDWIRGEDDKATAEGVYDGKFTANPGGFNRPAQGPITSWAGRRGYAGRFGGMHYGVDIGNSIGSAVRAAFDGVVKRVYGGGMDKRMVLGHGGFDTSYLHNSAHLVSPGQTVAGGQQIARMGTAGTGPHLHFEYHPGSWYNPSVGGVNSLFRDKGGLIYPGLNTVLNNTGGAEYAFNQQQFDNLVRATEGGGGGGYQVVIQQHGIDYAYADRNAQAISFAQRREAKKAGVR